MEKIIALLDENLSKLRAGLGQKEVKFKEFLIDWELQSRQQQTQISPNPPITPPLKLKVGYNLPDYSEKRTIAELLKLHGEYSYLTGKRLGTYYLSTLDIDLEKLGFPKKLIERL